MDNLVMHNSLFSYGIPPEGETEISVDDTDAKLPILFLSWWRSLQYPFFITMLRYGPFSGSALSNLVVVLRDRLADVVANLKVSNHPSETTTRNKCVIVLDSMYMNDDQPDPQKGVMIITFQNVI
ncbi:hypothetical protein H5410_006273 [Solanum commersonii]|uniref:Uncharacterized protein n=1 Tax=Solanum commersonii TaxID=4109 RepID=A0A9J6AAU4_SOLCO|nr:hypothetical protein H5410_006273 [Solanum commersonii]